VIGVLAYRQTRVSVEFLIGQQFDAVMAATRSELGRLMEPPARTLDEIEALMRLDLVPREPDRLAAFFVERLRAQPTWAGSATRTGPRTRSTARRGRRTARCG
jgi:hypothetical protein